MHTDQTTINKMETPSSRISLDSDGKFIRHFLSGNINDITDCCRRVPSLLGQILNPKEGFGDL